MLKTLIIELAVLLFVLLPLTLLIAAGTWYAFGPGSPWLLLAPVLIAAITLISLLAVADRNRAGR